METRQYYELFRFLMNEYRQPEENIEFVQDVSQWSEDHGISENDKQKPMKLIPREQGCALAIKEFLPEDVLKQRLNALRMHGQMVSSVPYDWADMLGTPKKKLAYLFLHEYGETLSGLAGDPLRVDEWAMAEMERLGFFK
ncbi:MAG: hypothetical protein M0Z58_00680 [Nitrospiraceae bacterium]|nr:hypothetical protein [Nitrospiraceae bacterium]